MDVAGDWREEFVLYDQTTHEIKVYFNDEPNPNPPKPRKWTQQHYFRQKMNFNKYVQ